MSSPSKRSILHVAFLAVVSGSLILFYFSNLDVDVWVDALYLMMVLQHDG
jgi:hypothetical protein